MKPLVSILIPAYDAGKACRDVAVGGPSDVGAHRNYCRRRWFQGSDSRGGTAVRVIGSRSSAGGIQGAAAARNKCLSLSQGTIIPVAGCRRPLGAGQESRQMAVRSQGVTNRTLLSRVGRSSFTAQIARSSCHGALVDLSPVEWLIRKWN